MFPKRLYIKPVLFSLLLPAAVISAGAEPIRPAESDMAMGIPLGTYDEVDYDICPAGVKVIQLFLSVWQKGDYAGMYSLIDKESRKDYPFEQAEFDFGFLEFKTYKINSIRKSGENFEFILSHGDWTDGDKDIKKMIISGTTFKIIMPSRNSPFKESLERYF